MAAQEEGGARPQGACVPRVRATAAGATCTPLLSGASPGAADAVRLWGGTHPEAPSAEGLWGARGGHPRTVVRRGLGVDGTGEIAGRSGGRGQCRPRLARRRDRGDAGGHGAARARSPRGAARVQGARRVHGAAGHQPRHHEGKRGRVRGRCQARRRCAARCSLRGVGGRRGGGRGRAGDVEEPRGAGGPRDNGEEPPHALGGKVGAGARLLARACA